jgi:transcriptional regulator with XRE-family HTH domain
VVIIIVEVDKMSESKKEIGERLRSAREKKGLKQNRVAQMLGVHSTTITKYESGEREPDADTLKKLAEMYDESVEYFLTGQKQMASLEFSPETIDFMGKFEKLPEDKKKIIIELLELYKNQKSQS